jgi:hypothetical protein
MFRLARRFGPF